tara:strand:- start:4144 stop:4986 length:843 start_codon:yes stop_codon:yes gene_type:complete
VKGDIMSLWNQEWSKFSSDAIEKMKTHADKTHDHREWMCYVYDVNGTYELGTVSYGGESRIEVSPAKKAIQDKVSNGLSEKDRKWTIHGHPLKDGKIYTGRQYFSSTDICREFVRSRDRDEMVVQFLVYPHKQNDTNTNKEVFHNRVRTLVFPNRATIVKAMKQSNPHVDPMAISVESGQNRQVKQKDGSVALSNESRVDWFKFQEALGSVGCMGIVDLEGPTSGSKYFNSEGRIMAGNFGGIALILALLWGMNKISGGFTFNSQDIEVVDDMAAYYHQW